MNYIIAMVGELIEVLVLCILYALLITPIIFWIFPHLSLGVLFLQVIAGFWCVKWVVRFIKVEINE